MGARQRYVYLPYRFRSLCFCCLSNLFIILKQYNICRNVLFLDSSYKPGQCSLNSLAPNLCLNPSHPLRRRPDSELSAKDLFGKERAWSGGL